MDLPASIAVHRQWYIFAEDFVTVLIGPFESEELAKQHLAKYGAGDAVTQIIMGTVANHLLDRESVWVQTPEQDAAHVLDMEDVDWSQESIDSKRMGGDANR